jgi:hypothetical protein
MCPRARRTARPLSVIAALVAAGAGVHVGCTAVDAPQAPSQVLTQPAASGGGLATTQGTPPTLVWKTKPEADRSTDPPTVTGGAPLEVTFNLCGSDDPDMTLPDGSRNPNGDSINWQFDFGDDDTPAFNEDGTFNPDFDRFCRTKHTYAAGTYIATLAVTDKHLDDQSDGVSAMARRVQLVRIVASAEQVSDPAPAPTPTPLPYCHGLPSWCPSQKQFCKAEPISNTSAADAKGACEACYGVTCVDASVDGNAAVAHGITAFYYSTGAATAFCTTEGYVWKHKPGDVADLTNNCGAGFW